MQYNQNSRLDSSQMRSGGGGGRRGGGIAVGGGASIIIVILALLFGFNPGDLLGGGTTTTTESQQQDPTTNEYADCETGADIEANRECRWVAYTNSIQAYWAQALSGYQETTTTTFTNSIETACGQATSQVGPFYCPADQRVYLDTSFFEGLLSQLGAEGGDAAEAYVIAHEYGHHIQNLTGVMSQVQSQGQDAGPESGGVRLELQADCYAGVWFRFADSDPDGPISAVTQDDLNRAIDAAETVGDDNIQSKTQGQVTPESWTHGSSAQRKEWLAKGFNTGDPNQCNTFSADALR
ncbi:MAG: neutral zinc metallopeptidase [Propionibacteriaceae bacterium]|nr:neutral zinc metallopeptidase [Propionibacteriaceae bacterium]